MAIFEKLVYIVFFLVFPLICIQKNAYNFVIAADDLFFEQAVHLIGTLHKIHFNDIQEIAFFDLGLSQQHRETLNNIAKVQVYTLITNAEHMLMPCTLNPLSNKPARGHYTWKAAVLKQALELFNVYIYIDAGISVVGRLDSVFAHIQQYGYFFIDSNQAIIQTLTKRVRDEFFLDSGVFGYNAISANFMGISRKIQHNVILPLYNFAHDLSLFIDDGTTQNGFGWSRHDQSLLSILIRRNGLRVIPALSSSKCTWVVRKHIIYSRNAIDCDAIKPYLLYR